MTGSSYLVIAIPASVHNLSKTFDIFNYALVHHFYLGDFHHLALQLLISEINLALPRWSGICNRAATTLSTRPTRRRSRTPCATLRVSILVTGRTHRCLGDHWELRLVRHGDRHGVVLRVGGARIAVFFGDGAHGVAVVVYFCKGWLLEVGSGDTHLLHFLQEQLLVLQYLLLTNGVPLNHRIQAHLERAPVCEDNQR